MKKTYKILDRILLSNRFAEENDIPNRWLAVGELIDFDDPTAMRLLEKGDIELYEPPKPAPKPVKEVKPPAKSAKAEVKEAK